MPKPIVAVLTETTELTRVANIVGLSIGVTAIVTVFLAIGITLFTAPAAPFLASVLDDTTTVTLHWTAPGDDGAVGQATAYDVRYSTSPITGGNFSSASQVSGVSSPKTAGGAEAKIVTGLQSNTTYYFAVKTVDDNGNWSAISNVVSHTTGCNPSWSCTAWSTCSNSTQTRNCTDTNLCGDTSTRPALSRSCTDTASCTPDWQCSNWSVCTSGKVYRKCLDVNSCGTSSGKPATSQSCTATHCVESWSCTNWGTCSDGTRKRSCADTNRCGTTTYKPDTSISCASVPPTPPQEDSIIVTGTAPGGGPHIRVFNKNGKLISQFFAYATSFRGGVTVAAGDVDGDGHVEIVTGTGPNSAPDVRVFSLSGKLKSQFYAYASYLPTGVDVAVADVNGDGRDDIITTPLTNGGPHVRVFTKRGSAYNKVITQFFAYNPNFRGGVSLAADDLNGDGRAEIVTVPTEKGGPHVRIFSYTNSRIKVSSQFFAFPTNWRLNLDVAVVNLDGPLDPRVVVSAGPGSGPHVRIFRPSGKLVDQFFVASSDWRGGVVASHADLDGDGWDELLTAAYSNGDPNVFVFKKNPKTGEWQRVKVIAAYAPSFKQGIRIFSPR